jgi:hypothetical protein
MADSTSSRILRAALFTPVPAAYLSMKLWRPFYYYGKYGKADGVGFFCTVLMTAVLLVSLLSWKKYHLAAALGLLAYCIDSARNMRMS